MPGRIRKSLLVCGFALALAGCGSNDDGTIPPNDADNLLNQLAAVESATASGDCETAVQHAEEFVAAVNALPGDVDPKVAGELTRAGTNLDQLVTDGDECTETGTSGAAGAESTPSTETVTPTETSTTQSTTDEDTSTIEETDEQPNQDPSDEPPTGAGQDQGGQDQGDQGGDAGGVEPPSGGVGAGGNAG